MRPIHIALGLLASCALPTLAQAANAPADVCVELVGWLDQREAQAAGAQKPGGAAQASAQPAGQPPAANQPPGQQQAGVGQDAAPRRDLNTAVEQAKPADPQKPGGQDEPQRTSGMTGPVTSAGPGAAGPQGAAQETAQSGAPNPKADGANQPGQAPQPQKPGDQPKPAAQAKPPEPQAPAPNPQAIEQARRSAQAQDRQGCRAIVRDMRLAGVALPSPLIALAALRADYAAAGQTPQAQGATGSTQQQGPAPGVPPIPPSGIPPGPPQGGEPR